MNSLAEWKDCERCGLHRFRRNVVIGRGAIPAKILFIGEAPGKSENLLGEPFVGPSGRILKAAIKDAAKMAELRKPPSYYITNVVGCRPTDRRQGENREPSKEEAWACWPRLEEIERMVHPSKIVFLGKVAFNSCRKAYPSGIHLRHPAFIARQGGVESREFLILTRSLAEIFEEITGG